MLHAVDEVLGIGDVLRVGVRGSELPALHALGAAVRVVGACVLALSEHRGVDLAAAAEGAENRAARSEVVASTRKARDGMLARRRRAMRLEEDDLRIVDFRQVFEHQGVRLSEAEPVAQRHHLIAREVLRRILYAEDIGVSRLLCDCLGNRSRIARNR